MNNQLPKRVQAHKTEDSAVDIVTKLLGNDFLVDAQPKYDYGIDARIEIFDGEYPTGGVFFAQIKGTSSYLKETGGYIYKDFPIKTLNYALLFSVPFFLFYVSTKSEQVRFIWLQKYYEIEFENKGLVIENKDTIRIKFPKENSLLNNKDKIKFIVYNEMKSKAKIKYISYYQKLLKLYNSKDFYSCAEIIYKIYRLNLIKHRDDMESNEKLKELNLGEITKRISLWIDYNKVTQAFMCLHKKNNHENEFSNLLTRLFDTLNFKEQEFLSETSLDESFEIMGFKPY
ncbi:DUF4365 domain-containing protein [Proteus columbae]|uniref:DUF4365 domain-containing protein n=1 Tax=Proteus columbae TaxID=1987580 RepID=UPI0028899654|nr:DUF4365 domain-containing protein [Proteus columbae]